LKRTGCFSCANIENETKSASVNFISCFIRLNKNE
jgi:hypothetical protein